MAEHSLQVQLSQTEHVDDRNFELSYTYPHYDMRLSFWHGDLVDTPWQLPETKVFGMAHSSELSLLAALVGYNRRQGIDPARTRHDFVAAGQSVLGDNIPDSYDSFGLSMASDIAEGEEYEHDGIRTLDWQCLLRPLPVNPGRIERSGGTGIYTKANALGELALIFAVIKPGDGLSREVRIDVDRSVALSRYDIPIIAKVVCDLSMGESRREIKTFLRNEFAIR